MNAYNEYQKYLAEHAETIAALRILARRLYREALVRQDQDARRVTAFVVPAGMLPPPYDGSDADPTYKATVYGRPIIEDPDGRAGLFYEVPM